MKCKCGQEELVKARGRRWRQHVNQFAVGVSTSHQKDYCLWFQRGTAPLDKRISSQWNDGQPRPQKMERLA